MISMLTIHQTFVESMQWWKLSSNQMVVNILHGSFEVRVMNSIQCRKCWFWRINKEISYLYNPAAIFWTPFLCGAFSRSTTLLWGPVIGQDSPNKRSKDSFLWDKCNSWPLSRCERFQRFNAIISLNKYKQAHDQLNQCKRAIRKSTRFKRPG